MCSWCWAFKPTWEKVELAIEDKVNCRYLLGGLAPDNDLAMGLETQNYIQTNWEKIQQVVPGTTFNFDFWRFCEPRRSTYKACRAVICAREQQPRIEKYFIEAIQKAYYLNAKNPSDDATLINIAARLGLGVVQFTEDLNSPETQQTLNKEIALSQSLEMTSFPSLKLLKGGAMSNIKIDYNNPDSIISQIIT
jgi:putative protein-disulfide isomerase